MYYRPWCRWLVLLLFFLLHTTLCLSRDRPLLRSVFVAFLLPFRVAACVCLSAYQGCWMLFLPLAAYHSSSCSPFFLPLVVVSREDPLPPHRDGFLLSLSPGGTVAAALVAATAMIMIGGNIIIL
jgi:hypothetical protein